MERPNGHRCVALVNIRALRDRRGNIQGAINRFQDVVEAKRMEDHIRECERHLRNLLEAMPAAIYTTDAAGRINFLQ
jgi:PAS domain-containing protein